MGMSNLGPRIKELSDDEKFHKHRLTIVSRWPESREKEAVIKASTKRLIDIAKLRNE